MNASEFRDAVVRRIRTLDSFSELEYEVTVVREPDEYELCIYNKKKDWSYPFQAPSFISILAALDASIVNGDFEDPQEKYPEYY